MLTDFIKEFKIHSLKGQEQIFCKSGKKCHYDAMIRYNVCFDLQNALKYTLVYGRHGMFQYLLTYVRYGEQLDHIYRGPHGSQQTLTSLCVSHGYYNGLIQLVRAGANMNLASVNERGETRNNLMATVDNMHYNVMKDRDRLMVQKCLHYLVKLHDINDQNSRGQTALFFANRAGNKDLADILLGQGANPAVVDMDGYQCGLTNKTFP